MFKQSKLVSVLAVAGIALFGAQAAQAQVVKIDGSSTVYPITEAVAEVGTVEKQPKMEGRSMTMFITAKAR